MCIYEFVDIDADVLKVDVIIIIMNGTPANIDGIVIQFCASLVLVLVWIII